MILSLLFTVFLWIMNTHNTLIQKSLQNERWSRGGGRERWWELRARNRRDRARNRTGEKQTFSSHVVHLWIPRFGSDQEEEDTTNKKKKKKRRTRTTTRIRTEKKGTEREERRSNGGGRRLRRRRSIRERLFEREWRRRRIKTRTMRL